MKKDKDIFDLFREKEPLLAEKPDNRNWRRIERRLELHDRHNNRTGHGHSRRILLGGSLLLVVALAGTLAVYVLDKAAEIREPDSVFIVESLQDDVLSPATAHWLEYSRTTYRATPIHISEGNPGQELIVRP
jgi:hypothetical protein